MTDADVDGSHIRTLLLTFFFRQIPQVIDKGYLYIAQPPLYKVKKGKKEMYFKRDQDFTEYFLNSGIEGTKIFVEGQDIPIEGKEIEELIIKIIEFRELLAKLMRLGYPERVLHILLREGLLEDEVFSSYENLESKVVVLAEKIEEENNILLRPGYDTDENENILPHIQLTYTFNLKKIKILLNREFIRKREVRRLNRLYRTIGAMHNKKIRIQFGENEKEVETLEEISDYIMDEAKKGYSIQRYKGLGEMNPDQLWETTMDPEKRTLLKVSVADMIEADETFTVLMGDIVVPRKEFIETNALEVRNLDI